uniref:G_PROTEIN_RECEP_F1_2 domain-containing protein n=1 Tax=Syphacia muris TaxID=451379 RepID=A0A0N5AWV8_9BILA
MLNDKMLPTAIVTTSAVGNKYWSKLLLALIPLTTILGNMLVILSVLEFKSLQTAINFLIFGLAIADLFVAVFVMPFAVYIEISGGMWLLGDLMCNIYSAADVACSTASILILAVISFDRYRAVSKPISYSRKTQNTKKVFYMLGGIWATSLALASPIVFGANTRPARENPHECRLYHPYFLIFSSIISFVIPCFVVLFVYLRIMKELRKREKAARLRHLTKSNEISAMAQW